MSDPTTRSTAEFVVVRHTPPGGTPQNVGLLLLIHGSDLLLAKFRDDWSGFDEDAKQILGQLWTTILALSQLLRPTELLAYVEESWSNAITVSNRMPVSINAISNDVMPDSVPELQQLFEQYVLRPAS